MSGNDSATKKLTPKQKLFIKYYLTNGGNATQACISAGYSENTAAAIGYENLRKPHINSILEKHQEEVDKEQVRRSKNNQYNKANSNIADYVTVVDGGDLEFIPFDKISRKKLACIKRIKNKRKIIENSDGSTVVFDDIDIDLYDATKSDENVLRMNGEFNDKLDISGNINIDIKPTRIAFVDKDGKKTGTKS